MSKPKFARLFGGSTSTADKSAEEAEAQCLRKER